MIKLLSDKWERRNLRKHTHDTVLPDHPKDDQGVLCRDVF